MRAINTSEIVYVYVESEGGSSFFYREQCTHEEKNVENQKESSPISLSDVFFSH